MIRHRILIVDDEPETVEYLARVLKQDGYEIYVAPSGKKALSLAEKNSTDLVLLDIRMHGLSGFDVASELRKNARTNAVPIIFISGDSRSETILSAFKSGGQDYITKPFFEDEVLARVRCQIELNDARKRLEELVADRTKELQKAVDDLNAEIRERQKIETKLERKNIALQEILDTLNEEKVKFRKQTSESIETLIQPVLRSISEGSGDVPREKVNLLVRHLRELFTGLSIDFVELKSKLSQQEYQIAAMIRNGATSKDIADALAISIETVNWHRTNIRKKLGIEDRGSNLTDILQSFGNATSSEKP